MINEIRERIDDQQVIDEIQKMLTVKVINFELEDKEVGTPQGSVLSPFLFNIYMHRLDLFMEKVISEHKQKAIDKKANPEYESERQKIMMVAKKEKWDLKKRLRANKALRKNFKRSGKELYTTLGKPVYVHYTRYAGDFLIGVQGDKELAKDITKQVEDFIKSSLHLTVSFAKIRHCRSDKTHFLGFRLSLGLLGPRMKGRTLERFKRLQARYKTLRKAEYTRYLRMLREGEKRFWVKTLEDNARELNQTMIGKVQLLQTTKELSMVKMLNSLESEIKDMKKRIAKKAQLSEENGRKEEIILVAENPRLLEAKQDKDKL